MDNFVKGITTPASLLGPNEDSSRLSDDLERTLQNHTDSANNALLRESIIIEIHGMLNAWVLKLKAENERSMENNGMIIIKKKEDDEDSSPCMLRAFGSYRLGVYESDSDIDLLCIAPQYATRVQFFNSFLSILYKNSSITNIITLPDAFVPVLKFQIKNISVDLLFSTLPLSKVNESSVNIDSDEILLRLEGASVRALNGIRVTEMILKLVPNVTTFRSTLRAVKRWAKLVGVYSNIMGYLGGVNWAILVARVCQLFPNADSFTLLSKFFHIYRHWAWENPVILNRIEKKDNPQFNVLNIDVWNPKVNSRDNNYVMAIITPAYPAMNSTFNVSKSALRTLYTQFSIADTQCSAIQNGEANWASFFSPSPFFTENRHYLEVKISSLSAKQLIKWSAWIESKLRFLPTIIEQHGYNHIRARLFPVMFDTPQLEVETPFAPTNGHEHKPTRTDSPIVSESKEEDKILDKSTESLDKSVEMMDKKDVEFVKIQPVTLKSALYENYVYVGLQFVSTKKNGVGNVDLTGPCNSFALTVEQWVEREIGMIMSFNIIACKPLCSNNPNSASKRRMQQDHYSNKRVKE